MSDPFRGSVPANLLYDTRYDMWVRREGGEVVIGATSFGLHLAGEVIAFTPKPTGAEVSAGRGLGTVESAKTVLAVHAPVAFRLDQPNEAAEERPDLINRDPYGAGWMARGAPLDWDNDAAQLVDAAAYVAHIRAIEPAAVIEA
ncbi:MAG: glycine cleavage system protein H [Sulfuritalea sp.]|nr:glycine cleavage system protein H [Sulfuritalea sp.]